MSPTLFAGTSGFSYPAWKGPFYPSDLPGREMLAFYATRLDTVEINNTFYRLPKVEVLAGWAEQVPDGFVFVLKAPQRITHHKRLQDVEEPLGVLWRAAQGLQAHLGPVLFQLPPQFRRDDDRLRAFLAGLPGECRAVLEFRHPSWNAPEVHALLRASGAALCVADHDDGSDPEIVATADFGYLRLRRSSYDEHELRAWAQRVAKQPWGQAFVFFKHEDEGLAPRLATDFRRIFREERTGA